MLALMLFFQAKAKERREGRRVYLSTPAHKHIMKMVADYIQIEVSAVEEFMLDSERVGFSD